MNNLQPEEKTKRPWYILAIPYAIICGISMAVALTSPTYQRDVVPMWLTGLIGAILLSFAFYKRASIKRWWINRHRQDVMWVNMRNQHTTVYTYTQPTNSRHIPRDVMTEVWDRDGGKCVRCGSQVGLEFDHIIPYSLGGSSSANNVQLLCQSCNRSKGNREIG